MAYSKATYYAARTCEFLAGVYLVVGALPKALDINRFSVQMSAYHVIHDKSLLPWFGLLTLFAEMAIGTAMVMGLRLKGLTLLALECMLVFFTVLIVYAWVFHGLEDCGCFPLIKMTPPVSIAKNVALFAMGLFAWRVLVSKRAEGGEAPTGSGRTLIGFSGLPVAMRLLIVFLVAAAAVGYAAPHVEHIAKKPAADGGQAPSGESAIDFGQFVFDTDMGRYDLGKGAYLVPILSMTCEDCMGKVPLLNDLMAQPGMPPMVALCYEDKPGDLINFRAETQPVFPLHALGDQPLLYFNLRGEDPFRLTLVRDGRAVAHWDERVPKPEEVSAALGAPGPGVSP